jgi:hypothetical protein
MTNGHLRLQALGVRLATFHQSGGTNEIAENLWVTQGWHNDNTVYGLSGGYLITSNSTAYASSTYYPGTRGFQQSGGTHIVRGTLFVQSGGPYPSGYSFSGGQLIVRDIHILGAIFSQAGGSMTHTGILILTGGHWKHGWSSAPQTQDFGMLQLKAARTNSTFTFFTGVSAMVRFAASAEMAWEPEARLVIQGWQAGSAGSRLHQIYFGTNRGGLTSRQLSQIRFRDPLGLEPGEYPAEHLLTGEIVPTAWPVVSVARGDGDIVVQWSGRYTLQTATNVLGPFTEVDAPSPYRSAIGTEPERYFRLRQ